MELTLAVFLGLIGFLVFGVHQRRQREEIRSLMDRVSELAERVESASPATSEESREEPPNRSWELSAAPSADVLAGRTSTVRRVVEGRSIGESLAEQAIAGAHAHLTEAQSPADLAQCLHVSLRTLERGLRVSLDCTPRQLILAMKMREARRRLLSGDHRVGEVALALGFSSPAHFSVRFRSFYREPPSKLVARARARSGDPA